MLTPDFATPIDPPLEGHVLVAGAGGLGCPAAWGLRASGVTRITILDPDVVELSNLPRQVLFTDADIGRPKALIAAERLGGAEAGVIGIAERLDHTNAPALLADVDVLIDATDGARTKDWLNQLAVRLKLPLVHAAGLQSEGRLLVVPAGGQPCLACLFGRLEEQAGSCADLGVWNGVVGTTGFLAAFHALRLLRGEVGASEYVVLDFQTPSAFALAVKPQPSCPVCGDAAPSAIESYPEPVACEVPEVSVGGGVPDDAPVLDLRTEHCPMNLLRARGALEKAAVGDVLVFELGEEGMATVPDGVRALGHELLAQEPTDAGLRLAVRRGTTDGAAAAFTGEQLERYARQLVLPDLGDEGQRRILAVRQTLAEFSLKYRVIEVIPVYLQAAGMSIVTGDGFRGGVGCHSARPAALEMAEMAAYADGLERAVVQGIERPRPSAVLKFEEDGRSVTQRASGP